MDDKEKVKKRNRSWIIFLFLAGALAAAARPAIHFFEALIADGYAIVPVSQLLLTGETWIDGTGRQFPR